MLDLASNKVYRLEADSGLNEPPPDANLAVVRRGDGTNVRVEFVTISDGDGAERNTTYLRAVAEPR